MRTENTVFISYRRSNIYMARAVYQDLRTHGYDVFLDYQSIDSGSFERVILTQIAARAHFVLVLTPSALERCTNPDDWVRREIEHAMMMQRNIVPLMFEEFEFSQVRKFLPDKLMSLSAYNGVRVPPDYFEEAMSRLRDRFLNKPLEVVLHPVPVSQQQHVETAISKEAQAAVPTQEQLNAEGAFERGSEAFRYHRVNEALEYLDKALELNPNYPEALNMRGTVHSNMRNHDAAIADFSRALALDKLLVEAYISRAFAYHMKDMYEAAIADYTEALRLNPASLEAYLGRGDTRMKRQDYERAIEDYEQVMRIDPRHGSAQTKLRIARNANKKSFFPRISSIINPRSDDFKPENAKDFLKRGIQRPEQDYEGKLADFSAAIERDPELAGAYFRRAIVHYDQGNFEDTIADLTQLIDLAPKHDSAYINRAEAYLGLARWDDALVDFHHAQEIRENSEHIKAGLAIANFFKGWHDEAKALWDELLESRGRQYKNAAYIGKHLNWHPVVTDYAAAMLTTLYADEG